MIVPVEDAQFVGPELDDELIAGVGFTVTIVLAEADGQLMLGDVYAAVAVTVYVPDMAVVAAALT
jgi:hypothetical protein